MPKATAVFDADDNRLRGALERINGRMLAIQMRRRRLQSHRLQSKRGRGGGHVAVAGVDGGASFLRRAGEMRRVGGTKEDRGRKCANFPAGCALSLSPTKRHSCRVADVADADGVFVGAKKDEVVYERHHPPIPSERVAREALW